MGKTYRHTYDEDDYVEESKRKSIRRRFKKKHKKDIDVDDDEKWREINFLEK